ncbi:MAG: JAB domain-containing protein [Nitrospiraceae bacterium]
MASDSPHNGSPVVQPVGRKRPYVVPLYRVALVRERVHRTEPDVPVRTSVGAASLLRPCFEALDREQFVICGLDAKHGIIGVNVVSIGSLTMSLVHPREVFKPLILMNAYACLCAHNHPSGDITPSPEDRALTSRLRSAGELLGITLLDHLILTEERMYSFADHDWP